MDRTYVDHIECCRAIAQYLVTNVPAAWARIEAIVAVEHDVEMVTSELKYWPTGRASRPKWFGIEDGETDVEFGNCFVQLASLMSTPDKGLFKKCAFSLSPDGRFTVHYEY